MSFPYPYLSNPKVPTFQRSKEFQDPRVGKGSFWNLESLRLKFHFQEET